MLFQLKGKGKRALDLVHQGPGVFHRCQPFQNNNELVPPQPGHSVGGAYAGQQTLGGELQQTIAGSVAQGVIDALEVVHVDKQQCQHAGFTLGDTDRLAQAIIQQGPIGQAGQGIVLGPLLKLRQHALLADGDGYLVGHELQQLLALCAKWRVRRLTLDQQHADHALLSSQRHTQPVTGLAVTAARVNGRQCFGPQQEGLTLGKDPLAERIHPCGGNSLGVLLVTEVGTLPAPVEVIAQGHIETLAGHQGSDDTVDLIQQSNQIVRPVGRLGDPEQGRLHQLRLLAPGNVAGDADSHPAFLGPACAPHDVDDFAVLAQVTIFELGAVGAGHYLAGKIQGAIPVVRMHQLLHRLAHHFFLGKTEHLLAGGGYVLEVAFDIDDTNHVEQQIQKLSERWFREMIDHRGYLPALEVVQDLTSMPCAAM